MYIKLELIEQLWYSLSWQMAMTLPLVESNSRIHTLDAALYLYIAIDGCDTSLHLTIKRIVRFTITTVSKQPKLCRTTSNRQDVIATSYYALLTYASHRDNSTVLRLWDDTHLLPCDVVWSHIHQIVINAACK
jgi:hypothetical protein